MKWNKSVRVVAVAVIMLAGTAAPSQAREPANEPMGATDPKYRNCHFIVWPVRSSISFLWPLPGPDLTWRFISR